MPYMVQDDEAAKVYELWEPEPAPNRGHDFTIELPGRGYPYDKDWETWSYPIGNGNLGATFFGRTDTERIQLTEKTFANESAYHRGGLTSAAELYLDMGHKDVTDYRRSLNLNDALGLVSYQSGGVTYHREYFASYPDDVLVIRLTADRPGALSFTVRPEIPYLESRKEGDRKTGTVTANGSTLTLAGTIDYFNLNYELQVRILNEGGSLSAGNGTLTVQAADTVTILVAADTNYELSPKIFLSDQKDKLDPDFNPHGLVSEKMSQAVAKGYPTLRSRHLADYRELFSRVSVNLDSEVSELPTSELRANYAEGVSQNYLEELLFQYGRYLLIASSRPTTLPANLQGAWSQYEQSPWTGGYWHNINVQMNYWGANITDLSETFEAYTRYFEAYLPKAIEYAQTYMKARRPELYSDVPEENGWIFGNGSNAYVLPQSASHSGPGTQAFITIMLMDYYDFTQDKEFLREIAYPAIRMLSRFYSKALIPAENGRLLVEDSASPEIKDPWPHPIPGGKHYQTTGCTYDQSLVWQNHYNLLRAAEILGENDAFIEKVRDQITRLDPILIGASGQIKEFREENFYGEIGDPNHRHISQLIGLYPGTLINTEPEWMNAASKTLDFRGNDTTGWAMAHRMNCRARLKEGDEAHEVFAKYIREKTLPNLWSTHPPFQIDGSLGVMAGVAEMLLQSHLGFIEPIPALPSTWPKGRFDGLVARGNFKVSAEWSGGVLTQLAVKSRSGNTCRLKYPGIASAAVVDQTGRPVAFQSSGSDEISFTTQKGMTYSFALK